MFDECGLPDPEAFEIITADMEDDVVEEKGASLKRKLTEIDEDIKCPLMKRRKF